MTRDRYFRFTKGPNRGSIVYKLTAEGLYYKKTDTLVWRESAASVEQMESTLMTEVTKEYEVQNEIKELLK